MPEDTEVTVEVEVPASTDEGSNEEAVEAEVVEVVTESTIDHEGRIARIEATLPQLVTRDDLAVVAASIDNLASSLNQRVEAVEEEQQEQELEQLEEQLEQEQEIAELQEEQEEAVVIDDEPPQSKQHWLWRTFGGNK